MSEQAERGREGSDVVKAEVKAEADAAPEREGEEREADAREGGGASGAAEEEAKASGKKPGRIQLLVQEFGVIALLVFLSISIVTYTGFVVAISAGFEAEGAGEEAGVWFAAWLALQATKPIRIPLTVVLTPVVAALWHRVRGKPMLPRE